MLRDYNKDPGFPRPKAIPTIYDSPILLTSLIGFDRSAFAGTRRAGGN
jgi:hypothetical protein